MVAFLGIDVTTRRLVLIGTISSFADVSELFGDVRVDAWVERNIDLVAIVMRIGTSRMTHFLLKRMNRMQAILSGVVC